MSYDEKKPPYELPDLRPVNNKEYRLYKTFPYEWDFEGKRYKLIVKEGHITDLASVPRIFWPLGLTPDGLYRPAALLHDDLYTHRGDPPEGEFLRRIETLDGYAWESVDFVLTRKEVDDLFLQVMKECGVDGWKRTAMYRAVRLFGWAAW